MNGASLTGKVILLVEDEYLVSLVVQEVLQDAGGLVLGPFARVGDALEAARHEHVDVAVLDVNVAGEMVFPVAELLEGKGTPFLFVTGYGRAALPRDKPHWEACTKPFLPRQLLEILARKVNMAGLLPGAPPG